MKAQKTFAYQKCAVHSTQRTPVSLWSASGTHKAQEIKAVNKGPLDKGSPDSYESRAGRELAAGSLRTRAQGHEKTNHSDEHEGHHLHLALAIHTGSPLFFFSHESFIPYILLSVPSPHTHTHLFSSTSFFLSANNAFHSGLLCHQAAS